MVSVKEYSILEEGDRFYVDCLLRDIPINVKIELMKPQFSDLKRNIEKDQINISGKVFIFDKTNYISFPTTIAFFPGKDLIFTKMIALRLPKPLSEEIS